VAGDENQNDPGGITLSPGMCNCSNTDLLIWGGVGAAVGYFFSGGNTVATALGTAAGILYRRHKDNTRRREHESFY
jgi:hypothetical protein